MRQEEAIKLANSKLEHEHARWNTWTLFFFGTFISVFTLWVNLKNIIPLYIPFFIGSILSLLWIFVAIGIRRVSQCWLKVIIAIDELDSDEHIRPNKMYGDYETKFNIWKDLFNPNILRVTKVLVYLGIMILICFLYGGIYFFNNPYEPSKQLNEQFQRQAEELELLKDEIQSLRSIISSDTTKSNKAHNSC